jgi:hypothetical protein
MKNMTLIALLLAAGAAVAQDKVPLKTELPKPMFVGTPVPIKVPNLEKARTNEPPPFLVPAGTVNLAAGKKVTGSDSEPLLGSLDLLTDGDKSAEEGSYTEFASGKQWVQIDLEQSGTIHAVYLWHFHLSPRVYHDVVVQVSDDPDFISGVTTVFNNDHDNSSGFGVGNDLAYVETNKGRLVDAKGVKGRYVRLYSKGSTANGLNHYIEVEVFGQPAG